MSSPRQDHRDYVFTGQNLPLSAQSIPSHKFSFIAKRFRIVQLSTVWNSPPPDIRSKTSFSSLLRHLKDHFFRCAFLDPHWLTPAPLIHSNEYYILLYASCKWCITLLAPAASCDLDTECLTPRGRYLNGVTVLRRRPSFGFKKWTLILRNLFLVTRSKAPPAACEDCNAANIVWRRNCGFRWQCGTA